MKFEIEDFNFKDKEYYKYIYEKINDTREVLEYEYEQLQWEYDLSINRCKRLIDDYSQLEKEIEKYRKILCPNSESSIRENTI